MNTRLCFVVSQATFAALASFADRRRVDLRDLATQLVEDGLAAAGYMTKENSDATNIGVEMPLLAGNGRDAIIQASPVLRNVMRGQDDDL